MGSIPASAPTQIQECVLQRLDTLQLSRCVLQEVSDATLSYLRLALASLLQETDSRMLRVSYMSRDNAQKSRSQADETRAWGNVPEAVARACT